MVVGSEYFVNMDIYIYNCVCKEFIVYIDTHHACLLIDSL